MSSKKILFALHDWGLGHASRSLVLIKGLLAQGHQVMILMAESNGLRLLRSELNDQCEIYQFKDIPKPFSRWPALFYVRMSLAMPQVWARYKQEHRLTERLVKQHQIDLVITDSRFGVWSSQVPSYCIFHSLRQIIPGRKKLIELIVEWGQRNLLDGFTGILIPDVEFDGGLSGDLGHYPSLDWHQKISYIGPLADVYQSDHEQDIDLFITISGIEPQRTIFAEKILNELPLLKEDKVVVTLGQPASSVSMTQIGSATIYPFLSRYEQAEYLNRAKLVVSRSGYTTLMELAQLGRKALFVPTPGQSEQEYLAEYHKEKGHVWATTQKKLALVDDLERAKHAQGIPQFNCNHSIENFLKKIGLNE